MLKDSNFNIIKEDCVVKFRNRKYVVSVIEEDVMILDDFDKPSNYIKYVVYEDKICNDITILN